MRIEGGRESHSLGVERRDMRTPPKDDPRTAVAPLWLAADARIATARRWVLVDAGARDVAVTLPQDAGGFPVTIKRLDDSANTVAVYPVGSATIDGAGSLTLTAQYEVVVLLGDGTNWHRVGGYTP